MTEIEEARIDDVQDTTAALRAGIALGKPRSHAGYKPYTIVPLGAKLQLLEEENETPARVKCKRLFREANSLIEYFNRYKDNASTLYADVDKSMVVGVIDEHQKKDDLYPSGARYRYHKPMFCAKHSPEWLIWTGKSGKAMKQEEFAVFIEDNAPDIKSPSAVDLYQMALNLEAAGSSEFKSFKRLEDGSVNFSFRDEVNGTSNGVPFPKELTVSLRPYYGSDAVTMTAKLRFRNDNGRLIMWFDLLRADQVKLAAFDSICEYISCGTEVEVFHGITH